MSGTGLRVLVAAGAAVTLLAAGCSKSSEQTTVAAPSGPASFTLGTVPKTLEGNVLKIPATVKGIKLAAANGDTSGKTGHWHIFIDKPVVAVGAAIPKEPGVVHTPSDPIKLFGLKVGVHTFRIVLGDGIHRRLPPAEQDVTVDVKGPSVWGTAPSTITKGQPLTIQLHSEGFDVMPVSDSSMTHESASPAASMTDASASPAASSAAMKQGHFHVLIDPKTPPKAGEALPAPEANKVIHTGASSVTINGLTTGMHVIWIVGGDMSHVAFDPPVMDKFAVEVT